MRSLLMTLLALSFTAGTFTACGNKNKNSVAATPVAAPPPSGANACLAGQVYTSSYGCLDRAHCRDGEGWVPTIGQCVAGTPITWNQAHGGTATLRWGHALMTIHRDTFEQLMREYGGFCDQYTWNWGAANCENYSDEGYIIIQASNSSATEVQITIGAGASAPYSQFDYWSAFTGTNASFPMQFRGTVYAVNAGTGMEIRAQMPTRSWTQFSGQGLSIYIPTGRITDNVLNAEISYLNQPLATAPVERY
ncbi:MAG: hypothetical protein NDI61_05945 [Bdellovibrionaceae bacterium]|nr:hypothetical protein [Pseudobdellovibrionaceae bacterium]